MSDEDPVTRKAHVQFVRESYDHVAQACLASKEPLDSQTELLLERLLEASEPMAPVLDLGCGAGVPVTQWIAARRKIVGVDLSRRQLDLCRQNVPGVRLIQADISELSFPPASFGAAIAMYAIIHVPRERHRRLLLNLYRWLRPGGRFLATWPMNEWEGAEDDWLGWGATMWWSHFGRDANMAMIEAAGFVIEQAIDRHGSESWCWVLARKET